MTNQHFVSFGETTTIMVEKWHSVDEQNIWYPLKDLKKQMSMDLYNVQERQALHENEDIEGTWSARGLEDMVKETKESKSSLARVVREVRRHKGQRNFSKLDADEQLRNFCLKTSKKAID